MVEAPSLSLEVATPESNLFIRRGHTYARKCASHAVLSRTQLTLHAARRYTSRRFALGASDDCLVGENPTCSVPAL